MLTAKLGRPRLIDDDDIIKAHRYMHQEGKSLDEVAAQFNVSRSTMERGLKRAGYDSIA